MFNKSHCTDSFLWIWSNLTGRILDYIQRSNSILSSYRMICLISSSVLVFPPCFLFSTYLTADFHLCRLVQHENNLVLQALLIRVKIMLQSFRKWNLTFRDQAANSFDLKDIRLSLFTSHSDNNWSNLHFEKFIEQFWLYL